MFNSVYGKTLSGRLYFVSAVLTKADLDSLKGKTLADIDKLPYVLGYCVLSTFTISNTKIGTSTTVPLYGRKYAASMVRGVADFVSLRNGTVANAVFVSGDPVAVSASFSGSELTSVRKYVSLGMPNISLTFSYTPEVYP